MSDAADVAFTAENRPWTRWWWMGNALTPAEITRHLELFHDVGIGGVEISPIYGARGEESRFVDFLSDAWIALLDYTLIEASRLGMGVDLIAGTGWPYGGPWVADADAPRRIDLKNTGDTLALVPTGQQVKRAAPGGEGNVVDPFSADAIGRYLAAFDAPLARLPEGRMVRCFFNDSYEVFGANATPNLLEEFALRRGYDLRPYLYALNGKDTSDTARRVRADYRATMGELLYDNFLVPWTAWAKTHGARTRQQAHGSPGNLLDLYAIADIPETENFGPPRLAKAGLTALRPAPPDFGEAEEALICRFASSAAHVAGRRLCSSESFTWMGEHGCVPLEHAKAEVDTLFTLGINHLFFHGTPSSPADAEWPGHLFYATTHVAPTNPWWRDLTTLNAYIARCQSVLQDGVPDNDILLYFPYYDLLAMDNGTVDGLHFLTVHKTGIWLRENLRSFTATANDMSRFGWMFDLISDRQLTESIRVGAEGKLIAVEGSASWKAIVVAGCSVMPTATLERLAHLAERGATVIFDREIPGDAPGMSASVEQSGAREQAVATLREHASIAVRRLPAKSIFHYLKKAGVGCEFVTHVGIECISRLHKDGNRSYFLANPGTEDWAKWLPLSKVQNEILDWSWVPLTTLQSENIWLMDPMTGASGLAETRRSGLGNLEIRFEIPAGGSLLVREGHSASNTFPYLGVGQAAEFTSTAWDVTFLEGGPTLPAPRTVAALTDWTTWTALDAADAKVLRAFSGTVRYTTIFDAPADFDAAADYAFDLGVICHSAKIILNGVEQGTLIARPWRMRLTTPLLATGNVLVIEVTNLMANRLADLERRRGAEWRPFLMVNIHYKPFDAATWEPLPSGLIGPVRLIAYPNRPSG